MDAAAAGPAEPPVPADTIRRWLRAEGADPAAPAEEQLGLAWRLLRRAETRLGELERRRAQDMRDVESYVGHVRALTEERDAIASEYEKENEQLRLELAQLQLQQETQLKEVEEMLEQEGLSQISCSAASEQVAYFLVERAALLGKLEVAARQLGSHNRIDGLQFCREELEGERASPAGVVGDLDEAPQRLVVSQEETQRVAEGLDAQSKEQSGADRTELQRAMEHNSRLDKEILALRARVQTLDLERKAFLELVEQLKEEICEYQRSERPEPPAAEGLGMASLQAQGTQEEAGADGDTGASRAAPYQEHGDQGVETLHKRCREAMESIEGRNSQLLHKLQKLEQEREGLVERNEELESILGETQTQSKQEKQQLESKVEGLHQKITSLETELLEVQKNKSEMNGNEQVTSGAQEMQEMLESCQETIDKLGSQLGERRERRKQLASELELLREDLKAEKVVLGSQGLPDSQSELKSHINTFPSLQRTSASRDLVDVSYEKLHKDSALPDPEASEVLQEREQSPKVEQKQEDPCADAKTYEEQMAKVVFLEEQIKNLREEQELLCSELLESNKKKEELEKQLKESSEEKRLLLEEIAQLRCDIRSAWEQGPSGDMRRMTPGLEQRENRFLPWQSSAGSLEGSLKQGLSEERFQQQEEKLQQLRQDLRRVQNLCSSAERELRYEREKNADLQRQNLLLQQECTKVKAELKQARAKLADTTETCSSLSAQWDRSQQKVKELELELSKCSQADKLRSSLQERLAQEKSRAGEAQKKVSKLQQKLKDSQHQLLLAEARVSDKKLLEEELKEARENEARVQQELHEEQLKRRLLEQQVEELRQQLRHSRETEASLAKMHVELQTKTLHVLEDEKKLDAGEHVQCQKENQKLSEQLVLLKEENKALYEEGVRLLNQKDLYVRKYNEMQLRHKDKIRRAKETFIHEVKQRDSRIKQLENELSESKLQVEKGKVLIAQITAENEKLLQERRRLLQKISDQEESPWSLRSGIPSLQSRGKILEEENARLQDKLQLSSHVASSQRLARSSPAPSTEDSKIVAGSERQPQSKVLPPPRASFPPRDLPEPLGALKAPQSTKPEGEAESQDSSFCLSPSQPSEIGYLNVASPGDSTAPTGSPLQDQSHSLGSQNF
ncbi:coiled-coil domain-containing protein 30 isoform X1 [Motacilla alba alba]|uniref:coiled-coil domain-containing protein 30 isoform X1 n=2 Tax=Motacilla alba alba TaxID=1094192 RepID=UPI0018D58E67|nr:coiled-coil domain-containing protein 30 isoform X1 [Motacilla alba alba]